MVLKAYAKINLGLRVGARRPDGYHELETFFQRIDLADEIELTPAESVTYDGPKLTETDEANLVIRAARRFIATFSGSGAHIKLRKRIPVGAGLGGGSSDAAAVLRGMARTNGVEPKDTRLFEIALGLGSDVPFFLLDRPAAIGRSRGEVLKSAESLPEKTRVVILWPGFPISTTWAYRSLDERLTLGTEGTNISVRNFSEGTTERDHLRNDFEAVVFAAHPELLEARDQLLTLGARNAGLSGSGSALYAVFDDEARAGPAVLGWPAPWLAFLCRPC
ncbi:MAG: 4-(cytidine 5'-diphospho)-2-C-methyl-D-erythritol kinase [Calditrichaeota bacterium]|nr:4-(cytidine 5'-diphospho)-2-C-methyl-D-erythritol kinase [Calditrichota bacterium]